MKTKLFRLLVLLGLVAVMHTACGGGGSSNTPGAAADESTYANDSSSTEENDASDDAADNSTDENLPEIADVYYDNLFRYKDISIYKGEYILISDPADTCGAFFGEEMLNTVTIESITDVSMSMPIHSSVNTFYAASQSEVGSYDMIGYTGTYTGLDCAVAFSSGNTVDGTMDLLGFACVDGYDLCLTGYEKASAYNFMNQTIKNTDAVSDFPDLTAALLRLLRPSL